MIEFSREAMAYGYRCEWGCYEFDFESQEEAITAYLSHHCYGQHIDSE